MYYYELPVLPKKLKGPLPAARAHTLGLSRLMTLTGMITISSPFSGLRGRRFLLGCFHPIKTLEGVFELTKVPSTSPS